MVLWLSDYPLIHSDEHGSENQSKSWGFEGVARVGLMTLHVVSSILQ